MCVSRRSPAGLRLYVNTQHTHTKLLPSSKKQIILYGNHSPIVSRSLKPPGVPPEGIPHLLLSMRVVRTPISPCVLTSCIRDVFPRCDCRRYPTARSVSPPCLNRLQTRPQWPRPPPGYCVPDCGNGRVLV